MEKKFVVSIKDKIECSGAMSYNFKTGKFEPIQDVVLEIGQKVFGELGCAYSEKGIFYCISEPDERGVQKLVEDGYKHRFLTWRVGDHDKPISKKFGIGMYWDDTETKDYRKPQHELDELIAQAEEQLRKDAEEAKRKEEESARKMEELRETYKGILTELEDRYDHDAVKKNILAYLKHKFKGVRFSAKKVSYYTYRIKWLAGPTEEEVRSATSIFVDHTFDCYQDYNDYTPTEFTKLFGGIEYNVETSRELKDEHIEYIWNKVLEYIPTGKGNEDTLCYISTMPEGVTSNASLAFECDNDGLIMIKPRDMYYILLRRTSFYEEPKEEPKEDKNTAKEQDKIGDDLNIVDYSDRSIAIIGNTRKYAQLFRKFGGKFNYNLTCGAGWIFKKSVLKEIKQALAAS